MTTIAKRLRIAARHDESQGRMMNEAADLIEQQQREIERQIELRKYAVEQLDNERKTATKLAAHVERLEDEITGIINDSVGLAGYHMNGDIASWQEFDIENILEQSPQTSIAEVKAKQSEHSYLCGYCDGLKFEADIVKIDSGMSAEKLAKEHADKIRNVKDGDQ